MIIPEKIVIYNKFQNASDIFAYLYDKKYAVIKGEALSLQAYGQTGMRHVGDIDILISRNEIPELYAFLTHSGFKTSKYTREEYVTMMMYSHQTAPWIKRGKHHIDTVLDINFDIFWGEYDGKRVDVDIFLEDVIETNIHDCSVRILPPIKAFIQLALHHYKEMNSIYRIVEHTSINYAMFKDVYYLWNNNKHSITLDKLISLSMEYEIVPYIYYILYYTNTIFVDKELSKYVDAFRTAEGVANLEYYGLTTKERKKWTIDFGKRLGNRSIYDFVRDDLTKDDLDKIERNQRIFG